MELSDEGQSQMFSRPELDRDVMTHWERLLSGEDCSSDALRRLIDDSWRRCLNAHVDPGKDQAPPPLSENSLYSLHQKHGDLLTASTPVMAMARDFLAETGTIMVLTDHSGTILSLEGDAATRDEGEGMNMMPGASWSETACGTNAIGTAIAVRHPVQIHSAEHYCAGIKRWTCSSTVILDPYDSSVLGAIDVSGLQQTYNRHSLALVVATASKIEGRLAKHEMGIRFRLLERCMHRLTHSTSDGVIVFDRRGNPVKANERADQALNELAEGRIGSRKLDIASITLGHATDDGLPAGLQGWISPEWLEPVLDNGQRIGTLLTIPIFRTRPVSVPAVICDNGNAAPEPGPEPSRLDCVVGRDPTLVQAVERARQLARSNVPVLLLGETGVGKEVFAQGIHDCGSARAAPFVVVNCGGLSRELLATELFGYAEGSFTGARRGGMTGKIEAANGGTLFLDELGEMPIDMQPHLLRVLEEGEIYRLGENTPRKVKFRLIAATNRDLRKEVTEGRFRMDLYYRVAVTSIRIPPLRERLGDIAELSRALLTKIARHHGVPPPALSAAEIGELASYSWPGNVRELRNVLESMLLTGERPRSLMMSEAPRSIRLPEASLRDDHSILPGECRDSRRLDEAEREAILSAIDDSHGNMALAARSLGIAKSTLYLKLKKFGLDPLVERAREGHARGH
ncbi:MAG: sigma-54-dependent Fis family transcriptional regulator [Gammaproteobacteria bacterium]|jgi:sigma-54 dependent transcriptional regulator, acetoin dehydrogenase operon transcriptional activator AcoR|nr:sigma-54-dependent Fis family transcriptional regulator [Gammaproteobacteria bacterium]MBU0770080.1 sigma-54-dependent Fis family transcriptional regulator [Gammaproteobacteria bacterium]MBU0855611.1 sigma-54-dependent Fis family transcriptional regulator [Gammaproteobacteria bacterium]MBU1848158.1 sigma-54-dependent Fis family transcriptional regulator [Gammaproteobacteria bacterium]